MSNRVEKHGEKIGQDTRKLISLRYHTVTKAVNKEFWNSISDTLHTMPLERTTAPSTGLTMTPFTAMCCGKSGNVPELP